MNFGVKTSKDSVCWRKTVLLLMIHESTDLLHPTLQTLSSFFVLKVENTIELKVYTHIHTFMLKTFIFFIFFLFCYQRLYTYVFLFKHIQQQIQHPSTEEDKDPCGCYWKRRKVEMILFLASSRLFMTL